MKRQHDRIVILLLACVLLVGCTKKEAAQDQPSIRKEFSEGPLQVQIELKAGQILLSELLPIRITVTAPAGEEIQWFNLSDILLDFRIRDWQDEGRRLLTDGRVQSSRRYHLEPLRIGDLEIPPLPFQQTSKNDAAASVLSTETITVPVATSLQGDLSQISLADIEEVVEIERGPGWLWLLAIAAVMLTAAAAVIFRKRSRQAEQAKKVYRPAHEIALERIRHLAGQNLIEQGRAKEFYERLSNCLRRYIENRFLLRAPERTTEEFLVELKNSSVLEPDHKQELKAFLEHSDLVKFARHQPTRQQSDQSLQMAERFVENTKSQDRLVEVGPPGEGA